MCCWVFVVVVLGMAASACREQPDASKVMNTKATQILRFNFMMPLVYPLIYQGTDKKLEIVPAIPTNILIYWHLHTFYANIHIL
jgi:hypothetical protein